MTNMTKPSSKKYAHRLKALLIMPLLLVGLQSCKQEKIERPQELPQESTTKVETNSAHKNIRKTIAPEKTLANLMAEIKANNCQKVSGCALVGIGAKPCGGPDSYAVYSKNSSNIESIKQLAHQYQQQMEQYYKDNSIMGICVVTPKPGVACQNNQCVLIENDSNLL